MSMLPIDMSITIQRTVELNRSPSGEATARPELAQDQFAERFNKDVRQQEQQVNQSNKTDEDNAVHKDGKGNSGYAGRKQKNEKDKKNAKLPPGQPGGHGSLFDVSI